jgi:hypothetical protein
MKFHLMPAVRPSCSGIDRSSRNIPLCLPVPGTVFESTTASRLQLHDWSIVIAASRLQPGDRNLPLAHGPTRPIDSEA